MNSPPRTDSPCTCIAGFLTAGDTHAADCLSLQPKQPAPGDEADTLTLLARHIRAGVRTSPGDWGAYETRGMDLIADARAERARIVQNSRHGEIRKQAFLELAEELAEMEPAQRDAHIRRIIDNQQ